ncbi:hypothetical protein LA14_1878 [Lactobacillus acidophilus La-14]|nr:hypothetical protein LA14_1878 [Lactobacillus acidophilus La-14]
MSNIPEKMSRNPTNHDVSTLVFENKNSTAVPDAPQKHAPTTAKVIPR